MSRLLKITALIAEDLKDFSDEELNNWISLIHNIRKKDINYSSNLIMNKLAKLQETIEDKTVEATLYNELLKVKDKVNDTTEYNYVQDCLQVMSAKLDIFSNPVTKGKSGEVIVENILLNAFPHAIITDVGKKSKSGDILIEIDGFKILIEVKFYKRSVPTKEIDKFKRDLECKDYDAGIFISLFSGVCNYKEIICESYKNKHYMIVPMVNCKDPIIWSVIYLIKILNVNNTEPSIRESTISSLNSLITVCTSLKRECNKHTKILNDEIKNYKENTQQTLNIIKQTISELLEK